MKPFTLKFEKNYFNKGTVLLNQQGNHCEVLTKPKRKWYLILAQILSFGFYKAPYEYLIKVIDGPRLTEDGQFEYTCRLEEHKQK